MIFLFFFLSFSFFFKEDPGVVCGAMGLCKSAQMSLAKFEPQEELKTNEIPEMDLAQRVAPFLLNVPNLLYPQNTGYPAPKQVLLQSPLCSSKEALPFKIFFLLILF